MDGGPFSPRSVNTAHLLLKMAEADSQRLLQDSNRELQILNALLQRTGSDRKVKEFADEHYLPLVELVVKTQLDESSKKLKARAGYLTGLSGIASFLASVQIGFVPLIGAPDCQAQPQPDGCQSHEILIRGLIFFFAYLALSLDSLGALFALLTARALFKVSSDAQDLMEEKSALDGSIIGQLYQSDSQLFSSLQDSVDDLFQRVRRQDLILKRHAGGLHVVISFILLGMMCFFVGLILLVIQSQPLKFWIPFVIFVFTMAIIVAKEEKGHHPRMLMAARKAMKSWMGMPDANQSKKDEEMGSETGIAEGSQGDITPHVQERPEAPVPKPERHDSAAPLMGHRPLQPS
ncbi:hypothetical protein MVEN_00956800 [Mycena venus]|uniref:Uncharacterized protein n=1 Tax=Mycena venus TaxID=2733690 RepID=A0A8H6Y8F7_9AGAR|nr:hypothetical protein MVEN_00956800 [Mycena venus]